MTEPLQGQGGTPNIYTSEEEAMLAERLMFVGKKVRSREIQFKVLYRIFLQTADEIRNIFEIKNDLRIVQRVNSASNTHCRRCESFPLTLLSYMTHTIQ